MSQPLQLADFAVRFAVYTPDASFHEPVEWTSRGGEHTCDRLTLAGERTGSSRRGKLTVTRLEAPDGLIRFRAAARCDGPIKAIKFRLELPYLTMLAPEQIDLNEAEWRQWDFPRDWRTGFAVWRAGGDRGSVEDRGSGIGDWGSGIGDRGLFFTVCTKEAPWRFKRIRALRTGDRMIVEVVQDASLRERSFEFESSEWVVGYRTDLGPMLDDYADFVAQAFGAGDFNRRMDAPDWLRRVGLVVNLHGTDWPGRRNLDFAGMTDAAERLAELFEPARTILYPIGWDGRYMRDYPDYQPAADLGGAEGFGRLCERTRSLGFHMMPHLNAMAVNMRHPLYLTHLKDYVMRDASGVPQHSFKIDWDHDGLGDAAHAYISLVPPALREILVAAIDRLVADFGIDAVFLDETCNVFYNDPAWDQVDGVRRLVRDIRSRHPSLLVAGEEWNEMLLGLTPLVQIWEETADGRKGFGREKSPLVRQWASRFVRSCGYLALASTDGTTGVHEWPDKPWVDERENESFYLPTLSISANTMQRGMDGVRATVERARDYVERFAAR